MCPRPIRIGDRGAGVAIGVIDVYGVSALPADDAILHGVIGGPRRARANEAAPARGESLETVGGVVPRDVDAKRLALTKHKKLLPLGVDYRGHIVVDDLVAGQHLHRIGVVVVGCELSPTLCVDEHILRIGIVIRRRQSTVGGGIRTGGVHILPLQVAHVERPGILRRASRGSHRAGVGRHPIGMGDIGQAIVSVAGRGCAIR